MNPDAYVSEEYGRVVPAGDHAYFEPASLPRSIPVEGETLLLLSKADTALGRLAGVSGDVDDPDVVVRPYLTREALASSRIEGTQTTFKDVLKAQADAAEPDDADVEEVVNYQTAVDHGIDLLDELPLCQRLVTRVHETLLGGVRGRDKRPGQFRDGMVWIGGRTPATAVYVPPPPEPMRAALDDWERFVNEPGRLPTLVRCALMHYQFETIHPFFDGNGRVGRVLITLMLMVEGPLPVPSLYLSGYFENNRREYYDRLQAVHERGEMRQWVDYFLRAVHDQATEAADRFQRHHRLRTSYREQMKGARNRSGEVVELLFSNPFVTVKRVQTALGVTNQGARKLITSLAQRGWLTPAGQRGRGGAQYWVAEEVYDLLAN